MNKKAYKTIIDSLLEACKDNPSVLGTLPFETARLLKEFFPDYARGCAPPKIPPPLMESERRLRLEGLTRVLGQLKDNAVSTDQAVGAVEDAVTLITDGSMPESVSRDQLANLLAVVLGKRIGSFDGDTVRHVEGRENERVSVTRSFLRGVELRLTWDNRLIEVVVRPSRIRKFRRATAFLGICANSAGLRSDG